ncbi:dihydroorotase [Anthocerotibacter panamensis]|uniref:dihydroorotase n=1 Tax=Anthocerotibacter panamensis TaxID=2857077 RepID=UPI001C402A29|nr:dihydroorotase [Anthocerotibacter panamensis]
MQRITLTRPDDWHLHLREGAALAAVLPDTARVFGRAMIMPNLAPPVTTTARALSYRAEIQAQVPKEQTFTPLMTLYLTPQTSPDEIIQAKASGLVYGLKLYPAGATTNSAHGVVSLRGLEPVLAQMEEVDLPLLVHGEVVRPEVDIFDRERVFITEDLAPLVERFPRLRVVFEHITTLEAVHFIRQARPGVAATVTAHHLLLNRNAMLVGGIRPHYYCLPVLKREVHRLALVEAATSGNPRFFLGTDSAPHARHRKETACGCAGSYTALCALELYAEVFEKAGALDKLEGFASFYGADFYGLPRNLDTITLQKQPWTIPAQVPFGSDTLIPFRAGEEVFWQVVSP